MLITWTIVWSSNSLSIVASTIPYPSAKIGFKVSNTSWVTLVPFSITTFPSTIMSSANFWFNRRSATSSFLLNL